MSLVAIPRPNPDEHPAYVNYVLQNFTDPDAMPTLAAQFEELRALIDHLPEESGNHRHAPGKWTLKEVLGHLLDQERVFAIRLLWFARGNPGPLPPFDHEAFVVQGGFAARSMRDLLQEFELLRGANLRMIQGLEPSALDRRGGVDGHEFTVRALAYLMAAHLQHHLISIRDRYLNS
jgi:hypothetical protein